MVAQVEQRASQGDFGPKLVSGDRYSGTVYNFSVSNFMRSCRGGYRLVVPDVSSDPVVRLRDGTKLPLTDISEALRYDLGIVLHGQSDLVPGLTND